MTTFKIEKGIPVPKARIIYPLGDLKVGESFLVPSKNRKSVAASAARYRPMKFTIRTADGGARVWRIA